ncbi:hypothetical protein [Nocardioides pakistanensis]
MSTTRVPAGVPAGGQFTAAAHPESPTTLIAAAPDRTDSRTWGYGHFPEAAAYDEMPGLVGGYDGYDHHRMPWLGDAEFTLTHNYRLDSVSAPCEAWQYTAEMDWDEDQADEADEHTADYEYLADALEDTPWDVPPLVVVERPGCGHHDLLDGNHRAGLALARGVQIHPAYVTTAPEGTECPSCAFTTPAGRA